MKARRSLLFALLTSLALPAAAVSHASDARAAVSFAITYDDIVKDSEAVAIVTPLEQRSVWEDNRIVTYTRLRVEEGVAGSLATGGETWVRTLGGAVGKIGQLVEGEPVFVQGKSSLIFARAGRPGTFSVVARAQGQFPVLVDPATRRRSLLRNANVGLLLARAQPTQSGGVAPASQGAMAIAVVAVDALHGRGLEDVTRELVVKWRDLHK